MLWNLGAIRAAFMPIRAYLGGQKFDGETIRLMGVAFEQSALLIHLDGAADRRGAKPPKPKPPHSRAFLSSAAAAMQSGCHSAGG